MLRAAYAKMGSHRASLLLARSRVAGVEAEGTAKKAEETLKELEDLLSSLKLKRQASLSRSTCDENLSGVKPLESSSLSESSSDNEEASPLLIEKVSSYWVAAVD